MAKKRIAIALVLVAVLLAGSIAAGTFLEISQPVSASLTIEGIGGNSPSFNILDNPATDTAGGTSGHIASNDSYVINFGGLRFGRAQTATVGSATDSILYVENNYAVDMSFDAVKTGGSLGKGTRIEVYNNVSIFGIPEKPEDELILTLEGADNPEDWVLTVDPGHSIPAWWSDVFPAPLGFYVKIVNEDAASSPSEGWDPKVRIVVRSD
jgi:hypothetical protein